MSPFTNPSEEGKTAEFKYIIFDPAGNKIEESVNSGITLEFTSKVRIIEEEDLDQANNILMYFMFFSAGVIGFFLILLGWSLIWSCINKKKKGGKEQQLNKPRSDAYKDNLDDTDRELKDLEMNVLKDGETMIKFFAVNINGDPKIEYTLKVIPPTSIKLGPKWFTP